MKLSILGPIIFALVSSVPSEVSGKDTAREAGTARWLTTQASWGTLTTQSKKVLGQEQGAENSDMLAVVLPFAADDGNEGRIFFYLMGESNLHGSALTLSEAALVPGLFSVPGCGSRNSAVDPQDPRCIKLTIPGSVLPCTATQDVGPNCQEVGWKALLEKHPSMANWPEDHDFHVHEFIVQDNMWMIASFGGASSIPSEEYTRATATEHTIIGGEAVTTSIIPAQDKIVPKWNNYATRARWIVHHSKWSTIATVVAANGEISSSSVFGNIRSITDGIDLSTSTGCPKFYLPDDDALAVHMKANNNHIVISLSEASLAQRVGEGRACGGQELPLCAQVALYGKANPISFDNDLANQFKHTHPLASWMAEGGSHMSGSYYTIEISKVVILDYFGGFHEVGVEDYLNSKLSLLDGGSQTIENSWWNGHSIVWMAAGFLIGSLVARYSCNNHTGGGAQYRTVIHASKTKENMEME